MKRPIYVEACLDAVAEAFAVPRTSLIAPGRIPHVAQARGAAMYLMRKRTTLSFPQIGRLIGGRHHTTAMAAVRRMKQRIADGDDVLRERLQKAEKKLAQTFGKHWEG